MADQREDGAAPDVADADAAGELVETTSHTAFRLTLTGFSIAPPAEAEPDAAGADGGPDAGAAQPAESAEEARAAAIAAAVARAEPLPDTLIFVARFLGESASSAPATKCADGTYDFRPLEHVFLRPEPEARVQNALLRGSLTVDVCAYTAATAKEEQRVTPRARLGVDLEPLLAGAARAGGGGARFGSLVTLEERADAGGAAVEMPADTRMDVALEPGVMTFTRLRGAGAEEGELGAGAPGDGAAEGAEAEGAPADAGAFSASPLVTEEGAGEGVIVTARLTKVSPVPAAALLALRGDADAAGAEDAPVVALEASVRLPCAPAHEADGGGFAAVCWSFEVGGGVDELTPPADAAGARIVVPASFREAILQKLIAKQPATLAVRPAAGASAGDELAAAHAVAPLDLSPLLEPGSTSLTTTVPLEAAGPQRACAWAGCVVGVELRLSRPIVPPWEAPDAPAMTVEKLIPAREMEVEPLDERGLRAFSARIEEIGKQMGEVYAASFPAAGPQDAQRQMTESEKVRVRAPAGSHRRPIAPALVGTRARGGGC